MNDLVWLFYLSIVLGMFVAHTRYLYKAMPRELHTGTNYAFNAFLALFWPVTSPFFLFYLLIFKKAR